jgi:hypothetical protein
MIEAKITYFSICSLYDYSLKVSELSNVAVTTVEFTV